MGRNLADFRLATAGLIVTTSSVSCYLGAVRYMSRDQVMQYAVNLIGQHGPAAFGRGVLRADLLLLKRVAFAHESEIRLICVDERGVSGEELVRIPIEPNELFEEVSFDPRLAPFERIERETVAKSLGYSGPFRQSSLYHRTFVEAIFPNGLEDPQRVPPNLGEPIQAAVPGRAAAFDK